MNIKARFVQVDGDKGAAAVDGRPSFRVFHHAFTHNLGVGHHHFRRLRGQGNAVHGLQHRNADGFAEWFQVAHVGYCVTLCGKKQIFGYTCTMRATSPKKFGLLLSFFGVLLFLPTVRSSVSRGEKDKLAIEESVIPVGKGGMRVLTAGNPQGLPVLLLHGATFRAELWKETGTMAVLASGGYYAVATDLPGHGKYVHTGFSREEVMWRLMEKMGLQKPVVVGHSLGGAYALSLIAGHSSALSGAVLIAPSKVNAYAARRQRNPLPVLVLWGTEDRMIPPRHAKQTASLFPNSKLVLLEGAHHECYQQKPGDFHAAILSFLKQL